MKTDSPDSTFIWFPDKKNARSPKFSEGPKLSLGWGLEKEGVGRGGYRQV